MKRTYKRTRARRTLIRRRRRGRKTLATKAYVRKLTNKAMESKRSATVGVITDEDFDGYSSHYIGQDINTGTTIQGRIGTNINLTGIAIRWAIRHTFVDSLSVEPWVHVLICQSKNNFQTPASRFYKKFDAGQADPYLPLDKESMNDYRRVFNTDDLKILKHYRKKIPKREGLEVTITNGVCALKHKCRMVINQNGPGQPNIGDINPPIWVYMYVTLGDETKYTEANVFQLDWCVNTYYKE